MENKILVNLKQTYLMTREYLSYCLLLSLVLLFVTCEDNKTTQELVAETYDAENITVNSAILKGKSMGIGIRSRGFVYNTVGFPTIEDDDVLPVKPGEGEFLVEAIELNPETKYYYCTYAFSDEGIVYGEIKSFTTTSVNPPEVTMLLPQEIKANSAVFSGTVVNSGSYSAILERGFVWSSVSEIPTIDDNKQSVSGDLGDFSFEPELEMNTTYYVRSYARSEAGIGYSETHTFKTLFVEIPIVQLNSIIPIMKGFTTNTTVLTQQNLIRVGLVFSETNSNPRLNNEYSVTLENDSPEIDFNLDVINLKPHTYYYLTAFAVDDNGVGYSEVKYVRTGTYGTINNQLVLILPPSLYKMGWTSDTDGDKTVNLFVNNDINAGNCVVTNLSAYWIAKYEVTNQEFCDFLNEYGHITSQIIDVYFYGNILFEEDKVEFSKVGNLWIPTNGKENYPARGISWAGANEFCVYYGGRLPNEPEWEIAARGGKYTDEQGKMRYSGSNIIDDVAWYSDNADDDTHPVGQLAPNDFGLYDMCGNVKEWAENWYQRYKPSWEEQVVLGPGSVRNKVKRGGSYKDSNVYSRIITRNGDGSANYSVASNPLDTSDTGFRFCLSATEDDLK